MGSVWEIIQALPIAVLMLEGTVREMVELPIHAERMDIGRSRLLN